MQQQQGAPCNLLQPKLLRTNLAAPKWITNRAQHIRTYTLREAHSHTVECCFYCLFVCTVDSVATSEWCQHLMCLYLYAFAILFVCCAFVGYLHFFFVHFSQPYEISIGAANCQLICVTFNWLPPAFVQQNVTCWFRSTGRGGILGAKISRNFKLLY